MKKEKAFTNWKHNSIHLIFPNGNAISTTWSWGSYSENGDIHRNKPFDKDTYFESFTRFEESDDVEIMILNAPDKLLNKIKKKYGFDSVLGYVTITQWLEILNLLSK